MATFAFVAKQRRRIINKILIASKFKYNRMINARARRDHKVLRVKHIFLVGQEIRTCGVEVTNNSQEFIYTVCM